MSASPDIADFHSHIPKLLRQQLLCDQVTQYLLDKKEIGRTTSPTTSLLCQPSIQRFHGALLFVDISGFTALSLKLDVDSLKNHINHYFSKMLEIVDKWGGDVIKFAGDALFIVWPTDIHSKEIKIMQRNMRQQGTVRSVNIGDVRFDSNQNFLLAAKAALEKAVACAVDITVSCGHFEVKLGGSECGNPSSPSGTSNETLLGRFLPTWWQSHTKIAPEENSRTSENIAYLDVHCGVSIGLMAGVDIGHLNRWEYILVGDPISRAAEAESQAQKGEVVLCKRAHRLLHQYKPYANKSSAPEQIDLISLRAPLTRRKPNEEQKDNLNCGCVCTSQGLFCIQEIETKVPPQKIGKLMRGKSRKSLDGDATANETEAKVRALVEELNTECDAVFRMISGAPLEKRFWKILGKMGVSASSAELARSRSNDSLDHPSSQHNDLFQRLAVPVLHEHFLTSMKTMIRDNLARHVHDAVRLDYDFEEVSELRFQAPTGTLQTLLDALYSSANLQTVADRLSTIEEKLSEIIEHRYKDDDNKQGHADQIIPVRTSLSSNTTTESELSPVREISKPGTISPSTPSKQGEGDQNDILNLPVQAKLKKKTAVLSRQSSVQAFSAEVSTLAEIRSVTVLFIKIDAFDLNLVIDASKRTHGFKKPQSVVYNAFRFLDRTENELTADLVLLERLQRCIEVIITALYNYKGQLRQFIVDDKGTVAIGTFGLKGSVGNDNAAAALEAAKAIIEGIEGLDLTASIGITTGKAYCGFVGSSFRHEYAVMGPSTNLSARLMGKAPPNEVICDVDTKTRDRTHTFEPLNEVTAKGYAQPVMTFKPIFESSVHRVAFHAAAVSLTSHPSSVKSRSPSKFRMIREPTRSKSLLAITVESEEEYTGNAHLKALVQSEFFVFNQYVSPSNHRDKAPPTGNLGRQSQLYGRQSEIRQIFSALFPKSSEGEPPKVFKIDEKATMVAICGSGGSGKTALLTSIGQKLFSFSRRDVMHHNIVVLQNRASSLHSKSPFHAWRPLFADLLKCISSNSSEKHSIRRQSSRNIGRSSNFLTSIDVFFQTLSPSLLANVSREELDIKSLFLRLMGLSFAAPLSSNPSDVEWSRVYHLCAEILIRYVEYCRDKSGKLLLIVMEEAQCLDQWSLYVVYRLWSQCTGIAILVSYCTTQAVDLAARIPTSSGMDSEERVESKEVDSSSLSTTIFRRFDDHNRFRTLTLFPLDRESTLSLLQESFELDESYDEQVQSVYAVSGGNPLYALELMKAQLSQVDQKELNSHSLKHQPSFGGSRTDSVLNPPSLATVMENKLSSSSVNHRIEEIICFRLDTLDSTSQLVLKAASIACSRSKPFTVSLLVFMLSEDHDMYPSDIVSVHDNTVKEDVSVTSRISTALFDLLNSDNFIQVTQQTRESLAEETAPEDFVVAEEDIGKASFEFQIPVEQATIYGLLIDEQKEYFHQRLGEFWEKKVSEEGLSLTEAAVDDGIDQLLEEAHHWERASFWTKAINTYFIAAQLSKQRPTFHYNSWVASIKSAYRCYRSLEVESEVSILPFAAANSENQFSLPAWRHTIQLFASTGFSLTSLSVEERQQLVSGVAADEARIVQEMFGDELWCLPVVTRLFLAMIDIYRSEMEEVTLTHTFIQKALKYYLLSVHYHRDLSLPAPHCPLLEDQWIDPGAATTTIQPLNHCDIVHFLSSYYLLNDFLDCRYHSDPEVAQSILSKLQEYISCLSQQCRPTHLHVLTIHSKGMTVYHSLSNSELLLSNISLVEELVEDYYHPKQPLDRRLFYQLFNHDSIPLILQLAQQRLLSRGHLTAFLRYQLNLRQRPPSPYLSIDKHDEVSLPVTAEGLVLSFPIIFFSKQLPERQKQLDVWFSWFSGSVGDEAAVNVVPFMWRRALEAWAKEMYFFYETLDAPAVRGEIEKKETDRDVGGSIPKQFQNKNKSFLKSAKSLLSEGTNMEGEDFEASGGVGHGVTRYRYKRHGNYPIALLSCLLPSSRTHPRDSVLVSELEQFLREQPVEVMTQSSFSSLSFQYSLGWEALQSHIILARLFQRYNGPVLSQSSVNGVEGSPSKSAAGDMTEIALLERDFLFYWRLAAMLLRLAGDSSPAEGGGSGSLPLFATIASFFCCFLVVFDIFRMDTNSDWSKSDLSPQYYDYHDKYSDSTLF